MLVPSWGAFVIVNRFTQMAKKIWPRLSCKHFHIPQTTEETNNRRHELQGQFSPLFENSEHFGLPSSHQ
jgi:hypothetical protein